MAAPDDLTLSRRLRRLRERFLRHAHDGHHFTPREISSVTSILADLVTDADLIEERLAAAGGDTSPATFLAAKLIRLGVLAGEPPQPKRKDDAQH